MSTIPLIRVAYAKSQSLSEARKFKILRTIELENFHWWESGRDIQKEGKERIKQKSKAGIQIKRSVLRESILILKFSALETFKNNVNTPSIQYGGKNDVKFTGFMFS